MGGNSQNEDEDLSSSSETEREKASFGGRKKAFRWNAYKDLKLVSEVEAQMPILTDAHVSVNVRVQCWRDIADTVNEEYNGGVDYMGVKRRFHLLLLNYTSKRFRERYKYGFDEVAVIIDKLGSMECLKPKGGSLVKGTKNESETNESTNEDEEEMEEKEAERNKNTTVKIIANCCKPEVSEPELSEPEILRHRKIQFRWNAYKDLKLVSEVEAQMPILTDPHVGVNARVQCWRDIADKVNEKYNGGVDYMGVKRRFHLLLFNYTSKRFKNRYKCGFEEVAVIIDKLGMMECLKSRRGLFVQGTKNHPETNESSNEDEEEMEGNEAERNKNTTVRVANSSSESEISEPELSDSEILGNRRHRKVQFRWNADRDLKLVTEVELRKPFLETQKTLELDCWCEIADSVNEVYNGDIDLHATRRRFRRVLSYFRQPNFESRYKRGFEEVEIISSKLNNIRSLMKKKKKLSKASPLKEFRDTNEESIDQSTGKHKILLDHTEPTENESDDNESPQSEADGSTRKTMFRWNAYRDLKLVTEVELLKPFLIHPKLKNAQAKCWKKIAEKVNAVFAGDVSGVAVHRRFRLLVSSVRRHDFKKRYRHGFDEAEIVVNKLKEIKLLMKQEGKIIRETILNRSSQARGYYLLRCAVPSCSNTNQNPKEEGLTMFSFPTDPLRRLEWCAAVGIQATNVRVSSRVCSRHFRKEDFRPELSEFYPEKYKPSKARKLNHGATPSLLLDPLATVEDDTAESILPEIDPDDITSIIDEGEGPAKVVIEVIQSQAQQQLESRETPPKKRKMCKSQEPCLLCFKNESNNTTELFQFPSSDGQALVNQQLWYTFILRKILKLPQSKYRDILKRTGTSINPSNWFTVCSTCSDTVNKILRIQEGILKLEDKVSKLKESVNSKCLQQVAKANIKTESLYTLNIQNEIILFLKGSDKSKMQRKSKPRILVSRRKQTIVAKKELSKQEPKNETSPNFAMSTADDNNDPFFESVASPAPENDRNSCTSEQADEVQKNADSSDEEWLPENQTCSMPKPYAASLPDPLGCSDNEEKGITASKPRRSRKQNLKINRSTNMAKILKQTKKYSHNRNGLMCRICSKRLNSKGQYIEHLRHHARTKRRYNCAYDCFKCKMPYEQPGSLRVHFRTVHQMILHESWNATQPQEDYVYTVATKKEVLERLKREGRIFDTEVYQCENCPKRFFDRICFDRHVGIHKLSNEVYGGRLDCFKCKAPHTVVGSLASHLRLQHRLVLDRANYDGSTPQEQHIKLLTGEPLLGKQETEMRKCTRCDLEFREEKGFEDHMKVHEATPESLHCNECQRPYPSEKTLQAHSRTSHKQTSFKCEICGYDTNKQSRLSQHILNHKIYDGSVDSSISSTEFVCNICKETFKSRRSFSTHRYNVHGDELGIEVFRCVEPGCSKGFLRKFYLVEHIATHHQNIRGYQCEQCGFSGTSKYGLKIHMLKHTEVGIQHICEHCSATYKYKSGLRDHMIKVHPEVFQSQPKRKMNYFQGVEVERLKNEILHNAPPLSEPLLPSKEFPCKYCDKVFPNKTAFNYHLKGAHKDMYSFNCDLCERVYMSDQSLQLHKKINHTVENTDVTCAWCHKKCSHRIKLYDHRKYCTKRPKGADVPKILILEESEQVLGSER